MVKPKWSPQGLSMLSGMQFEVGSSNYMALIYMARMKSCIINPHMHACKQIPEDHYHYIHVFHVFSLNASWLPMRMSKNSHHRLHYTTFVRNCQLPYSDTYLHSLKYNFLCLSQIFCFGNSALFHSIPSDCSGLIMCK